MRFHRLCVLLPAVALIFSRNLPAHDVGNEMAAAASGFLSALAPGQREKAAFDFQDEQRYDWHFIPRPRKGLPLQELTAEQRPLAHALIASALSHRGYLQAMTIMSLEHVLFEMEGAARKHPRESDLYFLTVFGKPAAAGTWGWRLEGHHLSLNFVIADGTILGETPSFFGSNPGQVREGARAGTRPLALEEETGRQLVKSLDEGQKSAAILAGDTPKEITSSNLRKVMPGEPAGLGAAKMNRKQRELLERLIRSFIGRHREEMAEQTWDQIAKDGLDEIRFAWAGGVEPGEPHYYKVQGPRFLLEYDNTQNNANHVHSVWRDFKNDFGDDLLKRHYEEAHPAAK